MANYTHISVEFLRQLVNYDPETGVLTWRARTPDMFEDKGHSAAHTCAKWNTKNAGKVIGSPDKHGYLVLSIFTTKMKSHRVAWAVYYGEWPANDIDHINRIVSDNRIANMREASHAENMQNKGLSVTNTSGAKGVFFQELATRRPWFAQIKVNRKAHYLGSFATREEAQAAYEEARARLHPYSIVLAGDAQPDHDATNAVKDHGTRG